MMTLSTGQPSTLGSYLDMCDTLFGLDSKQSKFILEEIKKTPNGKDEEVIAAESQMLYLLMSLK